MTANHHNSPSKMPLLQGTYVSGGNRPMPCHYYLKGRLSGLEAAKDLLLAQRGICTDDKLCVALYQNDQGLRQFAQAPFGQQWQTTIIGLVYFEKDKLIRLFGSADLSIIEAPLKALIDQELCLLASSTVIVLAA